MTFFLAFGSAFFYVAATYVMKQWQVMGIASAVVLILLTLGVGVAFEILALRQARLGQIYFIILGIECVLALLCASYLLRESYALHELLGMALIVAGVAVAHLPLGSAASKTSHDFVVGQAPTMDRTSRQAIGAAQAAAIPARVQPAERDALAFRISV